MEKVEVKMMLGLSAKLHPRFEDYSANDGVVTAWHTVLGDIDFDCACEALKVHAAANDFPPTVADLRKGVAALTCPAALTQGEAWLEVKRAISNYGIYRETEALAAMQPQVLAAVRQIGWRDLCMTKNDDLMATRSHFFKLYGVAVDKEREQTQMLAMSQKSAALSVNTGGAL